MISTSALLGVLISKLINKPHILTVQGGWVGEKTLSRSLFKGLFKYIIIKATLVHVVSTHLKNYVSVFRRKDIYIVPNGVDLLTFNPNNIPSKSLINKLGYSKQNKIIITTSRLVSKNGISDILYAFNKVSEKLPLCRLLIVGDGVLKPELKLLSAKLKLTSQVAFTGSVAHEVIPTFLAISDLFVRPSYKEGFGISFLEAMASGVPVIATPVGGITDFVHDRKTGLLVPSGNVDALSNAMIALLSNSKLRNKVTKRAINQIKIKYSWDNIVAEMEALYAMV